MFRFLCDAVRRMGRDERGNVFVLFGAAAIPLLLLMGGAVDVARYTRYKIELANATDAAALALARDHYDYTADQAKTFITDYINAHNVADSAFTITSVSVTKLSGGFRVYTDGNMKTIFLPLTRMTKGGQSISGMGVDILSEVATESKRLEVAIVLDNSGSMAGSKISTLKTAATNLTNTLFSLADNSTLTDPVKIGVVPFAASVNVGPQYSSASWMDTGAKGTYHGDAMEANGASTVNNFTLFNSLKDSSGNAISWGGCVEARPIPYDVSDDAPSTASSPTTEQKKTLFTPMLAPDEPDNWTCTTSSCNNSGSSNSNRLYNGAPSGGFSYNNYLPDAGDATSCSAAYNTFTVTKASPAVFTKTSHGLTAGTPIVLETTGSLYTGLTAGNTYYVISSGLSTNSFRVSTTSGGSAVNTSGSQSGTHKYTPVATWTCQSGSANCGGTNIGKAETTAFAGSNITGSPLCKYGTSSNKATVTSVTVGGIPGGPNFMCTTQALLPLTTNKTTVLSKITAMAAEGATSIVEGAMWGWRMLSPGIPFTEGAAYNDGETSKVLVLMTDGRNTYYPNSSFVKSWYDVYGYVTMGHLGTTSTNSSTLSTEMDTRTTTACANIKAAGITVYTVGFDITGSDAATALAVLETCASGSDYFYNASDNAELLAAFQAIGNSISNLHLVK